MTSLKTICFQGGFIDNRNNRNKMKYEDFLVSSLGKRSVVSPLKHTRRVENPVYKFVNDDERILYDVSLDNFKKCHETGELPVSFEKGKTSISNLPKPKSESSPVAVCVRD